MIDHDCRVFGRRVIRVKAYQLDGLLAWAGELASVKGFAGVVVACEPTGHHWRAVMGLADSAGWGSCGFVCAVAAGAPGTGGRRLHPRQDRS